MLPYNLAALARHLRSFKWGYYGVGHLGHDHDRDAARHYYQQYAVIVAEEVLRLLAVQEWREAQEREGGAESGWGRSVVARRIIERGD